MTLDEINEEHWNSLDVYLDTITLEKVDCNIELTGDAKDYFNEEGIYAK